MRIVSRTGWNRISLLAAGIVMAAAAGAARASVTVDITSSTDFGDLTAAGGDLSDRIRVIRPGGGSLVKSNNWYIIPDVVFHNLTPAPSAPYGVAVGGLNGWFSMDVIIGSTFAFDVHGFGIDLSLNPWGSYAQFPATIYYYAYDQAGNSLSSLDGSTTIYYDLDSGQDTVSGAHVSISSPDDALGKVRFTWYSGSSGNDKDLLFDNVYLNPEPTSFALLAAGALGLVTRRRSRA